MTDIIIPPKQPKVMFWDLEISLGMNLGADLTTMFCCGFKYKGDTKARGVHLGKYKGFKKTPWDDKYLVQDVVDIISGADEWVTWFGGRFDLPYVNAKAAIHGIKPVPTWTKQNDLWMTSRKMFKLTNNRLNTVAKALGCGTKLEHDLMDWRRAAGGNSPAIRRIFQYCLQDVNLLEKVYNKMCIYSRNGISLQNVQANQAITICPNCGSDDIGPRGYYYARINKYRRYHCKSCGYWPKITGPEKKQAGRIILT